MFLLVTVYWLREPSGQWGKWGIFPSIPLPANKDGYYMECVVDMKICVEVMFLVTIICRHNYQISWRVLLTASIQTTILMIFKTRDDLLSRQPPTPKPCWSCWLRHPRCLIEPGFCCRGIHKVMFAKTIWICLQNIVRITKLPFKSRVPRGWNQLMTRWSDSLNRRL